MESRVFFLLLAFALCITNTRQQHLQTDADQGSGSGYNDLDEDDEKTTRTTEGSGIGFESEHPTLCQRQRSGVNGFRPQCTSDGKFQPVQCRSGKCWCVDEEKGVRTSQPDASMNRRSKCGKEPIITRNQRPTLGAMPEGPYTDDFILDESSTIRPMYSERFTSPKTSRIQSTAVAVAGEKNAFVAFLLKDPLLFAGIVGGVVLALLCIVLAVMFTIYRMRKKDEGSYALDEPKKNYGFAYTRADEKEFFA